MEIRLIKKSEWEKLAAFNAAEYKPNHILTNKLYYDWQFDNYANPEKDSYTSVGMFDQRQELVGTFGRFPLPYTLYGKTVTGNCLANLIVKKNLRSLGFGYILLEQASALGDIAIDHTINETAWPLFMKAGWQGENLKRYIAILNSKNNLYDLPATFHPSASEAAWRFERIETFDGRITRFWQHIRDRYPITIERTHEYLNWRYAKNPLTSYEQFVVEEGETIIALIILRIEEVRREKPIGVRAARVIDFVASKEAERFALAQTIEFCRLHAVDFIDYFTSGNFHHNAFIDAGFVDGNTFPYSSLPLLFNPVSTKRTHLNFAVKKNVPSALADWYTTKGGGDQDRPY